MHFNFSRRLSHIFKLYLFFTQLVQNTGLWIYCFLFNSNHIFRTAGPVTQQRGPWKLKLPSGSRSGCHSEHTPFPGVPQKPPSPFRTGPWLAELWPVLNAEQRTGWNYRRLPGVSLSSFQKTWRKTFHLTGKFWIWGSTRLTWLKRLLSFQVRPGPVCSLNTAGHFLNRCFAPGLSRTCHSYH